MPAVSIAGLRHSYGDTDVLVGVDLDVDDGEVLAILGPSGCGKTTLLRLIAGLDAPDAGTVSIGDRPVAKPGVMVDPSERNVGLVFQDGALFPHLDVDANVAFGLPRVERGQRASASSAEWLELVGLPEVGGRRVDELSGGQRQRVALARALAPRPGVLLLDEPYSNLDAALRHRLRVEVRRLLEAAGVTTIVVTHDRAEAFALADRVAVMLDGRIVQVATAQELLERPASRGVAEVIGDPQFLPCTIRGGVAVTDLGELELVVEFSTDSPAGEVLVWPEQLTISPVDVPAGDAPVGVLATVTSVVAEGSTVAWNCRTDGGVELAVRTLRPVGKRLTSVGDRVRVAPRSGPFVAFGVA